MPALLTTLLAEAGMYGNGRSDKPRYFDSSTWWTVDDHLNKDVPAVLQYVLKHTGAEQVHWVGHSMGGMLAVGLFSQQNGLAAAIRSMTLIASGCFGYGSWHSILKPVINSITGLGFPADTVCQLLSLLSATPLALAPLETLFFWRANMHPSHRRKILSRCFSFIPSGVIRQFMVSLNTPQGLTSSDGTFRYADPQALQHVDVPVLGMNGDWDLFCPPAGGLKTVRLFGSTCKRFIFLGPQYGTSKDHYGHFDIVAGKNVQTEVYPHIAAWLSEHDAPVE
eukprot:jgi/Chrzof1/8533/Cz03g14190.t1